MKKKYKVSGLHCSGCSNSLTEELKEIKGINEVNFEDNLKVLIVEGENFSDTEVKKAVETCEFEYLGEIE